MRREEQLRPLVEAVMNEDMAAIEADRLGDGLGLAPFEGQNWPVSFDNPQWPLAFVALWISWRDPDRLSLEWERFRFWSGHIWRDPRSEKQTCSLDEAEAALWRSLMDGATRAIGLPRQEPDYAEIPKIEWFNLDWMPGWGKMSVRNFGHPDPRYRVVLVDRDDVLKLWPRTASISDIPKSPPPHAPRRRGPKSEVGPRVEAEMRAAIQQSLDLHGMKQVEMECRFNASADTCRKARDTVLAEFGGDPNSV